MSSRVGREEYFLGLDVRTGEQLWQGVTGFAVSRDLTVVGADAVVVRSSDQARRNFSEEVAFAARTGHKLAGGGDGLGGVVAPLVGFA